MPESQIPTVVHLSGDCAFSLMRITLLYLISFIRDHDLIFIMAENISFGLSFEARDLCHIERRQLRLYARFLRWHFDVFR